jgi:hypothetical protein
MGVPDVAQLARNDAFKTSVPLQPLSYFFLPLDTVHLYQPLAQYRHAEHRV